MIHTVKGFGIVSKAEVDVYTSINFLKICPLEAVMVTDASVGVGTAVEKL